MKKVFIDFGHGGKDPGAVGNEIQEKNIVLSVGLKVGEALKRHNVEVFYSRTTDVFIDLTERATMANKSNADVFVSLHCNSFSNEQAQGLETFSHPTSRNGTALAKCIQDSILKDKLYTKNRGLKTANFQVLRETKMTAALVELGFISNKEDAKILVNKQKELAESVTRGILNFLGIKYMEEKENIEYTNILGEPTATVKQMQEWARNKKGQAPHPKFIELAQLFYDISIKAGVNPIVTYTQSAKETGYMNFGGVLDISYNNPCGMKNSGGGGDYDPSAHKRFASWEDGINAQVDHLALYAGAKGYPRAGTKDPRHFPYLKGTTTTVEGLGGKWAPSKDYGESIVKMMNELESIAVIVEDGEDELDLIKISLHGQSIEVEGMFKDKTNYIPVKFLEEIGYSVEWKDNTVHIDYRKD